MKKKLITCALVGFCTISLGMPAFAASANVTGGCVEIKNQVVPFLREVVKVGGGTWNYGTERIGNQKHGWSYYSHDKKDHSASVICGPDSNKTGWVKAGTEARADLYVDKSAPTIHAYWNAK